MAAPTRDQCAYQSCYCEENIYLLGKKLIEQDEGAAEGLYAVFISNANRSVPFFDEVLGTESLSSKSILIYFSSEEAACHLGLSRDPTRQEEASHLGPRRFLDAPVPVSPRYLLC